MPESLDFCYDAMIRGTALEDSRLVVEPVAIEVHCRGCGHDSQVEEFVFRCAVCDGTDLETQHGDELRVREIEVSGG